jgi:gentisate 1,2-dioxygenase
VRAALDRLRGEAGDPYEGITLQFVNPVTGRPVYPTMDYRAQLLRPGEETREKRETSSTFVIVMEGEGYSEVGGQRFDWSPNDAMVMPNFLWRRHVNTGAKDAVLYTVSDSALMQNIGQYRAQGRNADGSITQIVG